MPSATDALRERMNYLFGDPLDDSGPVGFLQKRGFKLINTWDWRPPEGINKWSDLSADERDCICFLCDEWDFGGVYFNG